MNVKSIKVKLILLVAVSLILTSFAVVTLSLSRATDSLLESNMAQLDAVKESKIDHIRDFFKSVEFLLLSKASELTTIESVWKLDESFEMLADEAILDDSQIVRRLKDHYQSEYLNRVNYKFKDATTKTLTRGLYP